MKKLTFIMLALTILASTAFGAYGRKGYVLSFVDEFGDAVTSLTSVEIQISDSTTATIYADAFTTSSLTNPIVTGLDDGSVTFFYSATDCTVVATDGTYSRTLVDIDPKNPTIMFPSFLTALSGYALGDTDDLTFGAGIDITLDWDNTNTKMTSVPIADDTVWEWGNGTLNIDMKFMSETTDDYLVWDPSAEALAYVGVDSTYDDDSDAIFGSDSDWAIDSDTAKTLDILPSTTDESSVVNIGANTAGADLSLFAATTGDYVLWDASDEALEFVGTFALFDDDSILQIGTTKDFGIYSDTATILEFDPLAAGNEIRFGTAYTDAVDLTWYGDTTGDTVTFDEENCEVLFTDIDLQLDDAALLTFGTDDDFTIYSDTADTLEIDPGAAGDQLYLGTSYTDAVDVTWFSDLTGAILFLDEEAASVNFGVDATGLDAVFYGDTTLVNMMWDQSADLLSFTGSTSVMEFRGATVDAHETTIAIVEPTAANIVTLPNDTGSLGYIAEAGTANLSGAGAIPITDAVVLWSITGSDAATLADGGSPGQILTVIVVADSGTGTLTPASVTGCGFATVVFTNIGESATFMYIDSTIGWMCIGTAGVSTQPLLTQ